jgi:D-galactarolactone isomerase
MTEHKLRRRAVLAAIPSLAVTSPAIGKMNFLIPNGTCDSHAHIYDPRFAYRPDLAIQPATATVDDYQSQVQDVLGIKRVILITPSAYGADNRCLVDSLKRMGRYAFGTAVLHPDLPDPALKALHNAGVRGARVLPAAREDIEPLAARIAPLGWHLQISLPGPQIVEVEPVLMRQPARFIMDHFAHVPQPDGLQSPSYAAARRLVDSGRGWIKMSTPYEDSTIGPPDYPDVSVVARDFALHAPERMVWASAWPYPATRPALSATAMLNILAAWVPNAAVRNRILVENAEKFYGFDPTDRPRTMAR